MGKEQSPTEHQFASHHGAEARWRGYSLPDNQLPSFLAQLSEEICTAWQQEYENNPSQPLGIDNYKKIAAKVGYFSNKVMETAFVWYKSQDENKKKIGGNILGHQTLNPVLATVERIKKNHPKVEVDEDELMNSGLTVAQEVIGNLKQKNLKQFSARIATKAFLEEERILACSIGLPGSWVHRELDQKILLFRDAYIQINKCHPPVKEIAQRFGLKEEGSEIIIQGFLYPGEKHPLEEECYPEKLAFQTLLKEDVQNVLDLLSRLEIDVLKLSFGLIDGVRKTKTQIGERLNLNRQQVRNIEDRALKKLRHPRNGKRLKGYLIDN